MQVDILLNIYNLFMAGNLVRGPNIYFGGQNYSIVGQNYSILAQNYFIRGQNYSKNIYIQGLNY